MADTIEASFGLNTQPLGQGLRQGEQQVRASTGRMQRNIQSLFKRDPGQRAENALSNLVADLSTGNVAAAITGLSTRITALGLAAGVGIGAAVTLFNKFRKETKETDTAAKALQKTLNTPVELQGKLGSEGIGSAIEETEKKMEDLRTKASSWSSQIRSSVIRALGGKSLPVAIAFGQEKDLPEKKIAAARQRIREQEEAQAQAELQTLKVRKDSLTTSEEEAKINQINLKADQERAKLIIQQTSRQRSPKATLERIAAVEGGRKLDIEGVREGADIKRREVAIEQELADQEARGVSITKLKVNELKAQLDLIDYQLKYSKQLTAEERQRLNVKQTQTQNALKAANFEEWSKPPAQRRQEARQEQKIQQKRKEFDRTGGLLSPHFDMSGKLESGIDPITKERVDVPKEDSFRKAFPQFGKGGAEKELWRSQFSPKGVSGLTGLGESSLTSESSWRDTFGERGQEPGFQGGRLAVRKRKEQQQSEQGFNEFDRGKYYGEPGGASPNIQGQSLQPVEQFGTQLQPRQPAQQPLSDVPSLKSTGLDKGGEETSGVIRAIENVTATLERIFGK